MTREEYIYSLNEKSNSLYEFIEKQNKLIKLYENIIKDIEKGVTNAENEIMRINDELNIIDNWLGGMDE